jgi:hypothetical protein
MFPDDVLNIIINCLDVKSSINFLRCNTELISKNLKECTNRKLIVKRLTLINTNGDKIQELFSIIGSACKFGYLDIIQQYIVCTTNSYDNLIWYLTMACGNYKHNVVKYIFNMIIAFDIKDQEKYLDTLCNHAIKVSDMDFIGNMISHNILYLSRLTLYAAFYNKLNIFIILYNNCKHLFYNSTLDVIFVENNNARECPIRGFRLVDNLLKKPLISTYTRHYGNKPILTNNTLIQWSCDGESLDVINYLIRQGINDYNKWLTASVKNEKKDLIKYFMSLGGIFVNTVSNDSIFVEKEKVSSEIKQILISDKNILQDYNPYDILFTENMSGAHLKEIDDMIISKIIKYFIETIKLKNKELSKRVLMILNRKYDMSTKYPKVYKVLSEINPESYNDTDLTNIFISL